MTVRLLLVRHAETDANTKGLSQGHRDVLLNERGREQAAVLAAALASEPVTAVYSSDLRRASDTADVIARSHGLEVSLDARLREVHQGLLDGLTSAQMREGHAEFLARWRDEDPTHLRIPGGETLGEAQVRMVAAIEEIAARQERATESTSEAVPATLAEPGEQPVVVVVSHNLALRVLLCHALRVPIASFRRFRHDVACVAEVHVRVEAPWTVARLNDPCHLPPGSGASAEYLVGSGAWVG